MSTNPIQQISDLKAQVEQLTARNTDLQNQLNARPNDIALIDAIGARLSRVEQNLREDFVGKFAGSFLLATETITKRVVDTEEQQTKLEAEQEAFARRLVTHKLETQKMLDEADKKQYALLKRFVDALQQHNDRNAAILDEQQATLDQCANAAAQTAQAAALCTTFEKEYQAVSKQAGASIQRISTETQTDLSRYLGGLKKELRDAVEPVVKRVRQLTEQQYEWRLRFIAVGLVAGIFISSGVAWISQPSAFTQMQARQWQNWQSDRFTQDQAERLNKLFAEFEKENSAREAQGERNK